MTRYARVGRFSTQPILTSAAITYGLIWKAAGAMQNTDEFINDPRHPRFASGGKFIDLEKKD